MSQYQEHDQRAVQSVPLDDGEGGQYVVEQEAQGAGVIEGGGEFPDPHAEPTGPAPGTDPARRAAIEAKRRSGMGAVTGGNQSEGGPAGEREVP